MEKMSDAHGGASYHCDVFLVTSDYNAHSSMILIWEFRIGPIVICVRASKHKEGNREHR